MIIMTIIMITATIIIIIMIIMMIFMIIEMFNWIFESSKKKIIFFLCMYKMYLISAEGYKNAGVHCLKIRKTGEIWPSMKDVGNGLGVKNISDLVLKEIYGICEGYKKSYKKAN